MNNYSRISFNFGATLLSWLESRQPEIYKLILDADRLSTDSYSGHGTAIAQGYGHLILPLCNSRDKVTQIRWGIEDFRHRFGRLPEGMWLPETAVDLESLDMLAQEGILFTILAPRQAESVLSPGEMEWVDVSGGRIDPRRPYKCALPSGKSISIFFYDGPIAQELAFAGLLSSGEALGSRLLSASSDDESPQILNVATDGETYGHHHKAGEMALSYCLHFLEAQGLAHVVNYGEYLECFPPEHEVRIYENSSWSCAHGVERWKSDCGCNSGGYPGWSQNWRGPLRDALDWLRDTINPHFERHGSELFTDPWCARNDYISVILNRTPEAVTNFLAKNVRRSLSRDERTTALSLMEMQRHLLQMYTSCGWFFDELSGIETTQVLHYAYRALCYGEQYLELLLEDEFKSRLALAPSNIPENHNGSAVFEKFIKPARVSLARAAAHYAICSLFPSLLQNGQIYCFDIERHSWELHAAGKYQLGIGHISIRSRLNEEESDFSFAVLSLGDQNIVGGLRPFINDDSFAAMHKEILEQFEKNDVAQTLRVIDAHFEDHRYSLNDLFREEQRKILQLIFNEAEERMENSYSQVYQDNYHLMQLVSRLNAPFPNVLSATSEFVLNKKLQKVLETLPLDKDALANIREEIARWHVKLEGDLLSLIGSRQINDLVDKLAESPLDYSLLDRIEEVHITFSDLQIGLNLWHSQNLLYHIGREQFFLRSKMAEQGEHNAFQWIERFKSVSQRLGVKFGN